MSTTTHTAIVKTATRKGWDVRTTPGTVRAIRNGVTVRVQFTATGAVKSAIRSVDTSNVDVQSDTNVVGPRDAGKRATVIGWLVDAAAPVDPFTAPVAPVGYPVPGVDVPVSTRPVIDPFTDTVADDDTAPVVVAQLSDSGIGAAMARGHRSRMGHELAGVLVSVDASGITHVVRSCCTESTSNTGVRVSPYSFLPDAPVLVHNGTSGPYGCSVGNECDDESNFVCSAHERYDDDTAPVATVVLSDTAPVADTSAVIVDGGATYATATIAAPHGYTAPGTVRPDAVSTALVNDALVHADTNHNGDTVAYFARRVDMPPVSAIDVYRVSVVRDDDAANPRVDMSNSWGWSTPVNRDYNDPNEITGTLDVFGDMLHKYDAPVAYEIARLYGKLHGANVQPLHRSGHDGTLSTDDGSPVSGVVVGSSWSLFDGLHGNVDGVAVIDADEIAEQMKFGATGATIRKQLMSEIDTYNSWATGDVYGFVVERARITAPDDGDEFGEIGELNFVSIDDGSIWGYYGDDYGTNGIDAEIAWIINHDARESDTSTTALASVQSLHEGAIDTLVTFALQVADGYDEPISVHYDSPLARAIAVVQSPEFVDAYSFLAGRVDIATSVDDAPVWQA